MEAPKGSLTLALQQRCESVGDTGGGCPEGDIWRDLRRKGTMIEPVAQTSWRVWGDRSGAEAAGSPEGHPPG